MSVKGHRTALDIARQASLVPITTVAREIGITEDLLQPYGEVRGQDQARCHRGVGRPTPRPGTSW